MGGFERGFDGEWKIIEGEGGGELECEAITRLHLVWLTKEKPFYEGESSTAPGEILMEDREQGVSSGMGSAWTVK